MWAEGVLGVFESEVMREVLREVLGAKREEVRGGWKKHYSEELHDLCFWAELWHLGVWENRNVYRVLWVDCREETV